MTTFTKISIALFAASSLLVANTAAMAGPKGPQDFQNKPQPKFPGPKNPGDFKAPPKGKGPNNGNNNNANAAFGIMFGIGAIAAAAAAAEAANDETVCWKEKHQGQIVLICSDN